MKPPVSYENLADEWTKDAPWDRLNPDMAMDQIAILHAKYVHILTYHNLLLKKIKLDYAQKRIFKYNYYLGHFNNAEDLAKYNIEPFDIKVIKSEVDIWLNGDDDLVKMQMKQSLHEEIVAFCGFVIKELNARTYQVNGLIKYRVFLKGNEG